MDKSGRASVLASPHLSEAAATQAKLGTREDARPPLFRLQSVPTGRAPVVRSSPATEGGRLLPSPIFYPLWFSVFHPRPQRFCFPLCALCVLGGLRVAISDRAFVGHRPGLEGGAAMC